MNKDERLKKFSSIIDAGVTLGNKMVDSGYSPADMNVLFEKWAGEQDAGFWNWIDLTKNPEHKPDMTKNRIITGVVYFLGNSGDWCPLLNHFAKNKITKEYRLVVPVIIYPGQNSGKESHYCCMSFDFKPETDTVDIVLLEQHAMLDKSEKGYVEKLDYSDVIDFNLNNFINYCKRILNYTNVNVLKNKKPISRRQRVCGVVASEMARRLLLTENPSNLINSPAVLYDDDIDKLHERNQEIVKVSVLKKASKNIQEKTNINAVEVQR
ncbi:MAG: hypothetical protein J6W27_03230 [Alphaproteobacteria bacterium]|nr:hypothetical protein [Alphaproteobacteria bacterium]